MSKYEDFESAASRGDIQFFQNYLDKGNSLYEAGFFIFCALESEQYELAKFLTKHVDPNSYIYSLSERIFLEQESYYMLGFNFDCENPLYDETKLFIDAGAEVNAVDLHPLSRPGEEFRYTLKTPLDCALDPKLYHPDAAELIRQKGGKKFDELSHDEKLFHSSFYSVYSRFQLEDIKRYVEYKRQIGHRIFPLDIHSVIRHELSHSQAIPFDFNVNQLHIINYLLEEHLRPKLDTATYIVDSIIRTQKEKHFFQDYLLFILDFLYNNQFYFNKPDFLKMTTLDTLEEHNLDFAYKFVRERGGKNFNQLLAENCIYLRENEFMTATWELVE